MIQLLCSLYLPETSQMHLYGNHKPFKWWCNVIFTVKVYTQNWSNPWLHYQDSSNKRWWCREVICCNVAFIFSWIMNSSQPFPMRLSHLYKRAEQTLQTLKWWVSSWCHQICQLSRGDSVKPASSRSCISKWIIYPELISHFPNLRNSIKYGWMRVFSTSVATGLDVRGACKIQGQRLNWF